jgi:hypothetical protein
VTPQHLIATAKALADENRNGKQTNSNNMSLNPHPECYGQMFPDFENLVPNKPNDGFAFSVFIERLGIGTQRRLLEVKRAAWDKCVSCGDYRSCYDLGMAKVAMQRVLAAF